MCTASSRTKALRLRHTSTCTKCLSTAMRHCQLDSGVLTYCCKQCLRSCSRACTSMTHTVRPRDLLADRGTHDAKHARQDRQMLTARLLSNGCGIPAQTWQGPPKAAHARHATHVTLNGTMYVCAFCSPCEHKLSSRSLHRGTPRGMGSTRCTSPCKCLEEASKHQLCTRLAIH